MYYSTSNFIALIPFRPIRQMLPVESTEIVADGKGKFNHLVFMNLPEVATCLVICRKRRAAIV